MGPGGGPLPHCYYPILILPTYLPPPTIGRNSPDVPKQYLAVLSLRDGAAVATSGDYMQVRVLVIVGGGGIGEVGRETPSSTAITISLPPPFLPPHYPLQDLDNRAWQALPPHL